MDEWIGFVLAALALAGSPGPATLSLAAVGAAFGVRRGLAYMAGIVGGMVVVIGVTATGVLGVALAVPGATPVVAAMAAAYFVYLAIRIATAPPLAEGAGARRQPSFAGGLFLSLVNPKGYVAMAALFSSFGLASNRVGADFFGKLAVLVAIMTAVNIGWLAAGAAMTRLFRDPAANRAINVAFAILLLASVGLALLV